MKSLTAAFALSILIVVEVVLGCMRECDKNFCVEG